MFNSIQKYFVLVLFLAGNLLSQDHIKLSLATEIKQLPFGLTAPSVSGLPKIGIALSGGGSRSLAQIGVLKALEEKNINYDILVGTSMGSIVGGLYASGYSLTDLDSIVKNSDWTDYISSSETNRNELFIDQKITEDKAIITIRLDGLNPIWPTSLSSGHKISNFFTLLTLNAPIHSRHSFDEYLKKFRAISTDLVTGEMVVLDRGSLSQSMRASSSVSFLLAPVKVDSMLLVDGGLVSNIPVSTAKNLGSDFVIAINTSSPLHSREALDLPWNVADQIISIPMKKLNQKELDLADYILQPYLHNINGFEFSDIEELIDAAYQWTKKDSILENCVNRLYSSTFDSATTIINKLSVSNNPTTLEREVVSLFIDKNNFPGSMLYSKLASIINSGDYKNVSFELITDSVKTVLKILEEKNPEITGVELISGNEYITRIASPILSQLTNKIYNGNVILQTCISCLRKFRKDGFSLIDIEKISFDENNGTLKVFFTDGKISDIIIQGNERTEEELITREIEFEKDDLFEYSDLEKTLVGLRSTNLFEEVEVVLIKIGKKNIVTFKLKERPTQLMRFGFKSDNENQTQVLFDIRDENFLGSGTELGAILTGGSRNRSVILEHKVNRLFDTYLTYKLRAFYGFEDIYTYVEEPQQSQSEFENKKTGEYRYVYSGASFAIGTQVRKFGTLIAELKYIHDKIKDKANYSGTAYDLDLFSLKFALNIDSQDRYPYPTNGLRINSFYETGQTLLAGDVGFSKLYIDYKGYMSFDESFIFSPSFAIGFADETLPLSQQFSFGGQHKFFGFRENEYRGRQIFTTALEYRYKLPIKLFFDTYAKARYDLGSIWTQPEDIKFKDFMHGIGFTLSFDTPIGPADFSVGKGFIVKQVFSDNILSWGPTTFYFSIGYYY